MYYHSSGSLPKIWLTNSYERMDTAYGKAVTIQDLPSLSRTICKALIRKNC